MPVDDDDRFARLLSAREAEEFLYAEAGLLDERRYREWLDLLHEDIRYFAPIPSNLRREQLATSEWTREQSDLAWFDEGKATLAQRVQQIETGIHWAEEPASRVCRMVTNVEVLDAIPNHKAPEELRLRCRFLTYRNRLQDEQNLLIGKRFDTLAKVDGGWRLKRREIHLDQTVLLAKNLAVFL